MEINITKAEFRILVESGKAQSDTYQNTLLGDVARYEHIIVRGTEYTQTLYAYRHGYSWRSAAEGSHIFLESENGWLLEVAPIRYTKRGHDEGDTDPDRIEQRFICTRGGARPGAGRKPNEVKKETWSVKVTEEEKEKLKKYLDQLRKEG